MATRTLQKNKTSPWIIILLTILAVVFLGPPLMLLLLGTVGVLVGLAGAALKIGLVLFVIWGVVMILKGIFGSDKPASPVETVGPIVSGDPIEAMDAERDRKDREHLAELDRELELAVQKKASGDSQG